MLPKYDRTKAITISALSVLAVDLIVVLFDLARFKTNDDVGIMYRLMGEWMASAPTPYTLFSHVDVSRLLIYLYENAPGVPWYGLYLLLPISIIHYLVFYYGLRNHGSRAVLYMLGYMLTGGYYLFLELQFTIAASAWTASGLVLLVQQVRKDRWVWPTWLGIIFTVVGLLVRFKQAAVVLLCFLPLMVFFSINYRKQRRVQRGSILFLAVLLIMVLIQYRQVAAYAAEPHWKDAISSNQLRADLHDFKAFEALSQQDQAEVLRAVGWTRNDYDLFMSFFFWNEDRYSVEAFQMISDLAPIQRKEIGPKLVFKSLGRFFNPYSFAVLAITALLYFESRRMRRENWLIIYGIGVIIGLYLLSALVLKPIPERVSFGLFLSLFSSATVFVRPRPIRQLKRGVWLIAVVLFAIMVVNGLEALRKHRIAQNERQALVELNDYVDLHPNQPVIVWGARFPWKGITPFIHQSESPRGKALVLGSLQQTYASKEHAEALGIASLFESLLSGKALMTGSKSHHDQEVQMIRTAYRERFGLEVNWQRELVFGRYDLFSAQVSKVTE